MFQPNAPPRLKEIPQIPEKTWFWRMMSRVSGQRWVTVGGLLVLGIGGIVAADAVGEFVVDKLQIAQGGDDDDY